jgi:hypothetical protein
LGNNTKTSQCQPDVPSCDSAKHLFITLSCLPTALRRPVTTISIDASTLRQLRHSLCAARHVTHRPGGCLTANVQVVHHISAGRVADAYWRVCVARTSSKRFSCELGGRAKPISVLELPLKHHRSELCSLSCPFGLSRTRQHVWQVEWLSCWCCFRMKCGVTCC